jgi:hypothetical protein
MVADHVSHAAGVGNGELGDRSRGGWPRQLFSARACAPRGACWALGASRQDGCAAAGAACIPGVIAYRPPFGWPVSRAVSLLIVVRLANSREFDRDERERHKRAIRVRRDDGNRASFARRLRKTRGFSGEFPKIGTIRNGPRRTLLVLFRPRRLCPLILWPREMRHSSATAGHRRRPRRCWFRCAWIAT